MTAGTEKRHVSFLEEEAAEPNEETVEIAADITPHHLENDQDKEVISKCRPPILNYWHNSVY